MLPVIFALAWPTMLEELMQTLVQYIDTAMVGALGTEATAAVGATSTVGWMVGSSISALGVGFLAYIAKACGAGRKQEAHQASAQAAMVACIVVCMFKKETRMSVKSIAETLIASAKGSKSLRSRPTGLSSQTTRAGSGRRACGGSTSKRRWR